MKLWDKYYGETYRFFLGHREIKGNFWKCSKLLYNRHLISEYFQTWILVPFDAFVKTIDRRYLSELFTGTQKLFQCLYECIKPTYCNEPKKYWQGSKKREASHWPPRKNTFHFQNIYCSCKKYKLTFWEYKGNLVFFLDLPTSES